MVGLQNKVCFCVSQPYFSVPFSFFICLKLCTLLVNIIVAGITSTLFYNLPCHGNNLILEKWSMWLLLLWRVSYITGISLFHFTSFWLLLLLQPCFRWVRSVRLSNATFLVLKWRSSMSPRTILKLCSDCVERVGHLSLAPAISRREQLRKSRWWLMELRF